MRRELTNWNESPFNFMRGIEKEIGKVFDDAWSTRTTSDQFFTPTIEVEEASNHFLVSADLPGVKKEDINVEVHENQVSITGERKFETKKEQNGNTYSEKSYGKFSRTFTLPKNVDSGKVEANYDQGVLTLVIPKSEQAKARKIEVQDQKSGFLNRLL